MKASSHNWSKKAAILIIFAAFLLAPFEFSAPFQSAGSNDNGKRLSILSAEAKKKKKKKKIIKKTAAEAKGSFSTSIKIIGNKTCSSKTTDALKLLKSKTPEYFAVVEKYIGVIECADAGSGIYVWETPPRYKAGSATINAGTIWYAGTMAHESCHSKQYQDYLLANPAAPYVPSSAYFGEAAEEQCLAFQYDTLQKIGASQATLDYMQGLLDTRYWEIAYADRWW